MLGYAKLFKDKILAQGKAEGKAEVYRELQQAQKEGITLEELLEIYDPKTGKTKRTSRLKATRGRMSGY